MDGRYKQTTAEAYIIGMQARNNHNGTILEKWPKSQFKSKNPKMMKIMVGHRKK